MNNVLKNNFQSLAFDIQNLFADLIRLRSQVPSKQLTTFGLGVPVPLVLEPTSVNALLELVRYLHKQSLSWRILGAGSNIILPDKELNEVVIRLGKEFSGFSVTEVGKSYLDRLSDFSGKEIEQLESNSELNLIALGSTSLMSLSRKLCALGYTGLEFAAGIPASVGGAIKMNAGAHHHEMSEVVRNVFVLEKTGEVRKLNNSELSYSYRKSSITPDQIVLGAELVLERGDQEEIKYERNSCLDYRKKTQPLSMPSSGSVFKNPIEELNLSAGEILDKLGFKGKTCGGVAFSELHANWLVRISDEAKATDAQTLIESAQLAVQKSFSTKIQLEIIFW